MTIRRSSWLAALAAVVLVAAPGASFATSIGDTNLVDLIREASAIVTGQVDSVSDGIDERGIPYTEVTLTIDEQIRGDLPQTYTFRQFGLLAPRPVGDGRMMLGTPEGFPRYAPGEQTLLFLYQPAAMTGLQTTVALGYGKFSLGAGRAENGFANQGTFSDIGLAAGLATDNDQRILNTELGAVNPDSLLSFVRRAVQEHWIETAQMWKASEGRPVRPKPAPAPKPGDPIGIGRPGSDLPNTLGQITDSGISGGSSAGRR